MSSSDANAENAKPAIRAVIVPGNGAGDVTQNCMWYPWARDELTKKGVPTDLKNMPGIVFCAGVSLPLSPFGLRALKGIRDEGSIMA